MSERRRGRGDGSALPTFDRLWCRLTFRHRGSVDYIGPYPHGRAYWMCHHCGEVVR